jgi:hypothetical protein
MRSVGLGSRPNRSCAHSLHDHWIIMTIETKPNIIEKSSLKTRAKNAFFIFYFHSQFSYFQISGQALYWFGCLYLDRLGC